MDNNTRNITIHLVILEGPDGVGKSTLRKQMSKALFDKYGSFESSGVIVGDYSAGKVDYEELQIEYWTDPDSHNDFDFHGSQMEVDLHRLRYSIQMNGGTQNLVKFISHNNIHRIILIQDRSWVSSVVYNANNTFDSAKQHHDFVIYDMLSNIQDHVNEISYNETYIFVGAEDIDTIREHKKKRSEDDYYERLFPLEVLIPAYARKLEQVKLYCTAFGNKKVIEFMNDYDPKTMSNFVDIFIEDNLK